MSALASKKFAVIGCNVSARMAVQALVARFPETPLKWVYAEKDPPLEASRESLVCLPDYFALLLQSSPLKGQGELAWHFHFNKHEHELLSDFASENARRPSSRHIPLPLRRKIESLGLWNDLTPHPWTPEQGVSYTWTSEVPVSAPERRTCRWALFLRNELLKHPCFDSRYRAVGLEEGDERGETKVIYSAPLGSETFDALLWTSHAAKPRTENRSNLELKTLPRIPVAHWRSWSATVPHKSVSYLPELSLWLDSGNAGAAFLRDGRFRSGSLHKVFRTTDTQDASRALLQIETFELVSSPLSRSLTVRPDSFLWHFCPFLKSYEAAWTECSRDENMIYADPFPVLHHYAKGIDFWSGGPFGNISRLLEMDALWPNLKLNRP